MRIVYLNPIGGFGGAEALLLDLLSSVLKARPSWKLALIVPEPGVLAERAAALGLEVHVLPLPDSVSRLGEAGSRPGLARLALLWRICRALPEALLYGRRLKRKLERFQPDVVHSNGLKMHFLSAWCRPKQTQVIWHMHDLLSSRPIMARLLRGVAKRCFAAIAVSEHVRRDLNSICPALPVRTFRNAIDLHTFVPEGFACDLDSLSGLPPSEGVIRIGLVATMARWKGHEIFLEALGRVQSNTPIRAYLVGAPIYQTNQSQWCIQDLRDSAGRLCPDVTVGFTGFVARPAEAYRALDIVVHASTAAEPFGLVIAEAMSCGRAVIASSLGAPTEFLQDGITGLLHQAGNAEDLARKIEHLVEDREYRSQLGLEARRAAICLFDRNRLALEMIPVYESARSGANPSEASVLPANLPAAAE